MPPLTDDHYYSHLAACFCRGRLGLSCDMPDGQALRAGEHAALRLFKWKRNAELPRVRRVLGMLHGFAPARLLDVGSGRGTFLWPLLDELGAVHVTAIDVDAQRAADLACVSKGGLDRLEAHRMDACALSFADASFDGVTALEVLEHMSEPLVALRECMRVARRFVILSVPSREDDNPEHLHFLSSDELESMCEQAGARRVRFENVHNHLVAIATH